MLNPGLVGLGILDSFVCMVPMLTVSLSYHSPEISYLDNEGNGIMTADDLMVYVSSCVNLIGNPEKLEALREGCRVSAKMYTIENMACNFADGIVRAITA